MVMAALHVLLLGASSTPKQPGNWENWTIGVVAVLGVCAAVYWLMFTEPRGLRGHRTMSRRRRRHAGPS